MRAFQCARAVLAVLLFVCSQALRVALTHLIDLRYVRRDEKNPERYIYCQPDDIDALAPADSLPPLDGGSAAASSSSSSSTRAVRSPSSSSMTPANGWTPTTALDSGGPSQELSRALSPRSQRPPRGANVSSDGE